MLGAVLTNNSKSFGGRRFSDEKGRSAKSATGNGRKTKKLPAGNTVVSKAKPSARPTARTTKAFDPLAGPVTATEALVAYPQGQDTDEQYLAKLKLARDAGLKLIGDDVLVRHMIRSAHTSGSRRFLYSAGIQPMLEEIFGDAYMVKHERIHIAHQVLDACAAKFADEPKDSKEGTPNLSSYGTIEVREFANQRPKYVNNGRMAPAAR